MLITNICKRLAALYRPHLISELCMQLVTSALSPEARPKFIKNNKTARLNQGPPRASVCWRRNGCVRHTFAVLAVKREGEAGGAGAVVGARGVLAGLGTQPARVAPALVHICRSRRRSRRTTDGRLWAAGGLAAGPFRHTVMPRRTFPVTLVFFPLSNQILS